MEAQVEYFNNLGLELEPGGSVDAYLCCHQLPLLVNQVLDLSLVYTGPGVPPERSRTTKAHLLSNNDKMTAYDLAGRLHRDIQKGFIRAEVTTATRLLEQPSYSAAKETGGIRAEGKDYVLQPDDVVLIKWR